MADLKLRKKYYTGLQIIDAVKDLHLSYDDSLKLYGNLSSISTDDVAPVVHGRWMNHVNPRNDDDWACSNCGSYFVFEAGDPIANGTNYCPNCGAKMKG